MANQYNLTQLKSKFTTDEQWHEFLSFVDTQRVRGDAQELLLQWEIHLLKCQAAKPSWHKQVDRYVSSEGITNNSIFQ